MSKRNNKTRFNKNKQPKNQTIKALSDEDLELLIQRRERIRAEYDKLLADEQEKLNQENERYKKLLNKK